MKTFTQAALHEKWSKYLPELTKEPDFDAFWKEQLEKNKIHPLNPKLTEYSFPAKNVKIYDITIEAHDKTVIHGWYAFPENIDSKIPCIVLYHGFGGSRGAPQGLLQYTSMGLAVVAFDCRDQGGTTGSNASWANGSRTSVVSQGILDPDSYYSKHLYLDSIRALDFASTRDELDQNRIAIMGGSQGGALVSAVAALDDRPAIAIGAVPSNSNITARVMNENGSFSSVSNYLRKHPDQIEQCLKTLSYFDTMNMADKIRCPYLAGVGGKDPICPAEMFYATYNRLVNEKHIEIYPFNGHEGGGDIFQEIALNFIANKLNLK
ncbi:MAG: alpha/beta fold hydrolase [Kiritimatiellae bacterium]|jgi:cephalosporin-C deacetylase|nr:alpha/beta fold hydrolase [Kiritimatiellia bacterium]